MRSLFFISILTGSFLLFLVQPMLAKALLPLVGGAPAVWIVSMLFFQLLLLLGYGYSALGSAYMRPKTQLSVHMMLFIVTIILSIPLHINQPFNTNSNYPEIWVLATLLFSVGAPYFLLSANATLIQRWYHHRYKDSPYFLFSISNAGSLIGLLGYPFLIEWALPISEQMRLWSVMFSALLAILAIIAIAMKSRNESSSPQLESLGKNLPLKNIGWVVLLGFIPSSLFLSTTLYITTDIASFPLMWVIPLSLYLLSFILVFGKYSNGITKHAQKLHIIAAVSLATLVLFPGHTKHLIIAQSVAIFTAFFILAISCHGRVAHMKPEPSRLTAYYFWLSVGGALGGAFNTAAPYLFNGILEHYITLLISLAALPAAQYSFRQMRIPFTNKNSDSGIILTITATTLFICTAYLQIMFYQPANNWFKGRTFFGVSQVWPDEKENIVVFKHGTTIHGFQPIKAADKLSVTSYYAPIKKLLNTLPDSYFAKPFAIIGLGAGTGACFAKENQQLDFFEIDRQVIDIAQNANWFTYLRDCPPDINILLGDGRIELLKQPPQKYNLIVLDAFTSDAVPVHLLTTQAVEEYISKLSPESGLLAFNVSNRFLTLKQMLARQAHAHNWIALYMFSQENPQDPYDNPSEWVIMTPQNSKWLTQIKGTGFKELQPSKAAPIWSDDYSNILSVLR